MGNVNQDAILFNDTFYNNITFGVESATQEMVENAARIANAHDFIMATEEGYDTPIGDRRRIRSSGRVLRLLPILHLITQNSELLHIHQTVVISFHYHQFIMSAGFHNPVEKSAALFGGYAEIEIVLG